MGGTIASGGSAPMLPTVTWAGTAAYGSSSDAGVIGGGLTQPGVAMSQPAVMPQPTMAWQPVQPTPAPQLQLSVAPTTLPTADIIAALNQLTGLLQQLASILAAQQGAANVQGGGGMSSGCGCGGGGAVSQTPAQSGGAQAAPDAPQAARSDKPKRPAAQSATAAAPAAAPAGGSVREKIVAKAREELDKNVSEDAGADKDKAGNIRRYRTAVTGPGENPDVAEPWCADFASWIWKQAGTPWGTNGQGDDYTPTMVAKAKADGTWKRDPQPGDMVFIDWAGGEGVDHVAIVEKVENGRVHTIGGNESNRLKTASYAIGDPQMMGFVSPKGA